MSVLEGKTVLVTGGTGSFGKCFIQMALEKHRPKRMIVFSRDEFKQFNMRNDMPDERLSFFIGDVRDKERLCRAFKADVDIVIHAAALKHVTACEYNPFEAVKTNIHGTQNVIDACIDCGVDKAIIISTDKAVGPVNLYGATKLCAEKIFVQGNVYSGFTGTSFSCVRYGNVLGSRGSVIPLFLEQAKNGYVTMTDARMTRFWIRLETVCGFVLDRLGDMYGGEIFVPKMASTRIIDLVDVCAKGCEVRTVGIRPGEKLHESLISIDEGRNTSETGAFFVVRQPEIFKSVRTFEGERPVPEDFFYSSDTNDWWLNSGELCAIVDELTVSLGLERR